MLRSSDWGKVFLVGALLLGVEAISPESCLGQADDSLNPGPVEKPDFQKLLESGLKVRRPQEFAFINNVMQLIETDQLPAQMVRSTFLWARRKRRPFQSFEYALIMRAQNIGVSIDSIEE